MHGDVFRAPYKPMFLSVIVGSGAQLVGMALVTLGIKDQTFSGYLFLTINFIAFAALGFLSPSNRGSLLTALVVLFFLFAGLAGYVSARVYKMMGGEAWKSAVLMTALTIPGYVFCLHMHARTSRFQSQCL